MDLVIKSIGDKPVWGMTDDNVDDKLWRCNFFVVELVDSEQKIKVGLLQVSRVPFVLFYIGGNADSICS